jgi:hypothetical protein
LSVWSNSSMENLIAWLIDFTFVLQGSQFSGRVEKWDGYAGIECRALCKLFKYSSIKLHHQPRKFLTYKWVLELLHSFSVVHWTATMNMKEG